MKRKRVALLHGHGEWNDGTRAERISSAFIFFIKFFCSAAKVSCPFSVSTTVFESSFVLNVCEIVVARGNYPIILSQLLHLFHQIRTIEYHHLLHEDGLKIRFLRRLSCPIRLQLTLSLPTCVSNHLHQVRNHHSYPHP